MNNKLGIGTVQFGINYGISNKNGKTSLGQVKDILHLAQEQGVVYLDTASAYGEAERVLGECEVKDFKIVSKFMPPDINNLISKQLEKSLIDLKVEKLYGYLSHRPSALINDKYW